MRNTTKLKLILQLYTVSIDMEDDEQFILLLIHKNTNDMQRFEGKSYSTVIAKAYSFLLRSVKE